MQGKNICISGFIKNISSIPQRYHHSYMYQSSEIIFVNESGTEIRGYDYRERKDYDHTIYSERDYHVLNPDQEAELITACFVSIRDTPRFQWGPFQFQSLEPGKYRAYLEFHIITNDWTDKKTGIRHELKDVWLGKITSEKIGFVIK